MDPNQAFVSTGTDVNDWRNGFPIHQHFSAPSTFINFRQPGNYNVSITFGKNNIAGRVNPDNPSMVLNRQATTTTFGSHAQTAGPGGPPRTPVVVDRSQQTRLTMASTAGNGIGNHGGAAQPPQNDPSLAIPTPDYSEGQGQTTFQDLQDQVSRLCKLEVDLHKVFHSSMMRLFE